MKLTRERAIKLTQKVWEKLAETGQSSARVSNISSGLNNCYLCRYQQEQSGESTPGLCEYCPLPKKGAHRCIFVPAYREWMHSITTKESQEAARKVLEYIKDLK